MIQAECRVIPAPKLSDQMIRALSKGWIVDIDDRSLLMGDAFELEYEGETFWTMCRKVFLAVSLHRMSEEEIKYTTDQGHPLGGGKVRKVETPYVWERDGVTVYIDIPTCGLTLAEGLTEIERLKTAHPDEWIEMDEGIDEDGSYRVIIGRRKER